MQRQYEPPAAKFKFLIDIKPKEELENSPLQQNEEKEELLPKSVQRATPRVVGKLGAQGRTNAAADTRKKRVPAEEQIWTLYVKIKGK